MSSNDPIPPQPPTPSKAPDGAAANARPSQLRSRLTLLLIAVLFLGSFGVAAVLRFAGWTPPRSRNFGELLQPPRPLGVVLRRADGTPYAWAPEENRWRLLVVPAPGCTTECTHLLDTLRRTWLTQGRRADRLDVLWMGPVPGGVPAFRRLVPLAPDAKLVAALPQHATPDTVPVYLLDPEGVLVLHYRPGFDPTGLRKDLGKLVK
jgi:cytochrome oxidase Cu insertion factor (SCO1/SenC/PrrC family)